MSGVIHPTSLFLAIHTSTEMLRVIIFCSILFCYAFSRAQEVTSQLRGVVSEEITGFPVGGASVTASGKEIFRTVTSEDGRFILSIPVGRYKLSVSYTGYATSSVELVAIAGKPVDIQVKLTASDVLLNAIEVQGTSINEVAGLHSLTIEKSLRVPANFFDPVRVVTSYPGVITTNDQNNSIIIRGNSPNGLLWRLNGLDIVNPNHLANAGTFTDRPAANGGGVNILSAQILGQTDFYTGFIPSSYGNALSGVIDMSLRPGNKQESNYTAQASVIGIDLAAEGPLKKDRSSYLANYRYSTVGLLSAFGVDFGDEAISFQDFSFNANTELAKGELTVFGFWGASKNIFDAKTADEREEQKDLYDIDFEASTYAAGFNFSKNDKQGLLTLGAVYSASSQLRNQNVIDAPADFAGVMRDHYDTEIRLLSTRIDYNLKLHPRTTFSAGLMTNVLMNDVDMQADTRCQGCPFVSSASLKAKSDGVLLQPHVSMTTSLSSKIDFSPGVRLLWYSLNDLASVEPRVSFTFNATNKTSWGLTYSLVSQLQQPEVYFSAGNDDLGFTKSHHVDLLLTHSLKDDLKITSSLFYQHLFDVPVETVAGSTFSTVNLQQNGAPPNLINDGSANNYGIDATIEKFFFNNTYFLIGGGVYRSTFKTFENQEFNSQFDGGFTVNSVYGKEWAYPSKNRTIGLNTRVLYLGGLRESAINLEASEETGETVFDTSDPFSERLANYFRVDLRFSLRRDKPGYTRTLALDIQNLFNNENDAYHYYDAFLHEVKLKKQLGLIPVIVYRIDF
jgi:hypothetical protein